jgi:hypothetical protein
MKRGSAEVEQAAAGCRGVLWVGTWVVAASLAGCGGGGGKGASSGEPPPTGNPPPPGDTGSIRVKVTDALGEAVAAADVWLPWTDIRLMTGPDGIVQLNNVPTGNPRVCANSAWRGGTCSVPGRVTVEKDTVVDLSLELEWESTAAAVLSATVDPGGVSADGKSLDVALRVVVSGPYFNGSWFLDLPEGDYNRLQVPNCDARTGDQLAQLGPRCIRGTDGSDASYSSGQITDLGMVKTVDYPVVPWAAGLLVDQSDAGHFPVWLPNGPELFAAKVFSDRLLPATPLLLGGFASDGPSGLASPLPQRPVTFFPVESPVFLASRAEAFGVLGDLPDLVGGEAPLYQAIAEAVDYMAARSPPERQRALVVLADGVDTTCGTPAQCAAQRRDIIDRARDAAVELFIVAQAGACLPDFGTCANYPVDTDSALLLAREGGFPIAVGNATGLELARQWLSGSMTVQDIRLRLTSDTEGAFAPGAAVMGALMGANASECPMGCQVRLLSFTVEVPE